MSAQGELAELRRRAYGAEADIARDPVALARLRELEERERIARAMPEPPPVPEATAAPGAVPAPGATPARPTWQALIDAVPVDPAALASVKPAGEPPTAAAAPAASASSAAPAEPARSRPRRALVLACAATAVATAALAVPATLWISGLADRPYAVLEPDADAEPMRYFEALSDDALRYPDFFGVQVTVGSFSDAESTCILFTLGSDAGTGSCSPAGIDPRYDMGMDEAPVAARNEFGEDAVLRFVVEGDEVRVFVLHPTLPAEERSGA